MDRIIDWIKDLVIDVIDIAIWFEEYIIPVTAITILVTIYCLFVVAVGMKMILWIVPELLN